MRAILAALGAALLVFIACHAQAHEERPGFLALTEFDHETWDVLWKVPARGDRRLGLYVRFPASCEGTDPTTRNLGDAQIERWRVRCVGGLAKRPIHIDGLSGTRTDVLARIEYTDGSSQTARLTPDAPSFEVPRASVSGYLTVVRTYVRFGIEHILFGPDHLLFVMALLLLVKSKRRLFGAITAFTVAHSITLAAATLGWVRVPTAPIEAGIALSIVLIATEIARGGGLAERRPWIVAFCFGLLHGLGFASALREVGIPVNAVPFALASFNIGVEIGQLIFVAAVLGLFALGAHWMRPGANGRRRTLWEVSASIAHPATYAIGALGAFWLIERVVSFWRA